MPKILAFLCAIVVITPCLSSIRVEPPYSDVKDSFDAYNVSISNMGVPSLQFRCQSADDDLGYHTLKMQETYSFSFTIAIKMY
ncbi:Plant self-incompatibility S1 [Cynara cardunculus var. scolymus]|uniref:Plant self-incompatibility S1 n=1 Tax=Cynara cardunculus var. scolymus TaxID=59895 RepID=A0A103Y0I7_CYNCS|nr:Plant self-incompatibility S1 [Cynara cardunculus var. scolymus]